MIIDTKKLQKAVIENKKNIILILLMLSLKFFCCMAK